MSANSSKAWKERVCLKIRLEDSIEFICELLDSGKEVAFVTNGTSMVPMLRDGTDCVYLVKKENPERGDVLFFRRPDGQFILHRIIGIKRDGSYVIRGDNRKELEYGITKAQAIAVVKAFDRDGRHILCTDLRYRLYCVFLPVIRVVRIPFWKAVDAFVAARKKRSAGKKVN